MTKYSTLISKIVELNVFTFVQFLSVDEAEGVSKFLSDATAQWKNLALEVRSVRSMLEEVISNWEKHSSTVAALQAWLEDAEQMLNQSENVKRVSTISVSLDQTGGDTAIHCWGFPFSSF